MRRVLPLVAMLVVIPALVSAQGNLLNQGQQFLNRAQPSVPGGSSAKGASLSTGEIGSGLKEALRVASQRTIGRVGKADGYLKDPAIKIPLPNWMEQGRSALRIAGASGLLDDLEVRMNRAAEAAAPKATQIFVNAIQQMSIDDARSILNGPQDAATQYFKRTTTNPLTTAFKPVVDKELQQAGAVQAFDAAKARAGALGGAANFDFSSYVLEKALGGLFHYLGQEEAAIRANPAARSTDLLKKVFG
jgi:hypothetical protein